MFAIRNRMVDIKSNFNQKIFNGNITEQIETFEKFIEKLERYKEKSEKR